MRLEPPGNRKRGLPHLRANMHGGIVLEERNRLVEKGEVHRAILREPHEAASYELVPPGYILNDDRITSLSFSPVNVAHNDG